jgi:hypothetical protein
MEQARYILPAPFAKKCMRVKKIFLLSLVVVCVSGNLSAQYNMDELQGLRNFLIQESALIEGPYKDAQPKNYFCISGNMLAKGGVAEDNYYYKMLIGDEWETDFSWIATLRGVTFASDRITKIEWSNINPAAPVGGCGGVLDLTACDKLTTFVCIGSSLMELYLNGTNINDRVNVRNNALTRFEIINAPEEGNGSEIPTLWLEPSGLFDCTGNKLKFANMPQVQVFSSLAFLNLYYSANQADSTNITGNELKSEIDLKTDYYVDFSGQNPLYAPTKYVWKYTADGSPVSPGDYEENQGVFKFADIKFENVQLYCEMTNNFFGYPGVDVAGCILTLKYYTTILPKTETFVSNPTQIRASVYFSTNTLYVNSHVAIKSALVFDLHGKQLFAGTFNNNEISIDGSNWQKGLYFVHVISDAGVIVEKVMNK